MKPRKKDYNCNNGVQPKKMQVKVELYKTLKTSVQKVNIKDQRQKTITLDSIIKICVYISK